MPEIHRARLPVSVKTEIRRRIYDIWPSPELLQKRAQDIIRETSLNDFLKQGGKYLDIGCGFGHTMPEIERQNAQKGIQIMGVDIAIYPSPGVKRQLARQRRELTEPAIRKIEQETTTRVLRLDFDRPNGQNFLFGDARQLPITDKAFDGASLFYVLHHVPAEDQIEILEEAKRVIGDGKDQYIFITEDIVASEEQRAFTQQHDAMANWESPNEPHYYRSNEEWLELFSETGLEVVKTSRYASLYKGKQVQHAAYVLRKSERA